MLAVTEIAGPAWIDIYQCPEGKSAVVYIDLYYQELDFKVEISIAVWNKDIEDYVRFTYWTGTVNFISLGPIWLNSKDKIQGLTTAEGSANCFVHGVEF
jgi:hypothetical protein